MVDVVQKGSIVRKNFDIVGEDAILLWVDSKSQLVDTRNHDRHCAFFC
jgi:hypothetical protein